MQRAHWNPTDQPHLNRRFSFERFHLTTPSIATNRMLKIWIAFLLIGLTNLTFAQNDRRRDERTEDFFGRKEQLRRDEGRSRFRLPIEITRWRTIDGTMNNLVGINWGFAGGNLRRRIPSAYADGVSAPSGEQRKSARAISNYVCNQNESLPNRRNLSAMVWQWGQFLDHDIVLTETAEPAELLPILVPTGDRYFDPFAAGGQQIFLFRSQFRQNRPANEPREQVNSITSWIDGSNVYGSDDKTARDLRTLQGGRMKTSEGNLLPLDDGGFFLAGDVRANEQVCLTSMHTLFVREHNRIADRIASINPALTDEQIYVRARQRVTGIIQAITYNEFLPALIGPDTLSRYRGYNPMVFPNITNTFATAAYRFGHSMIDSEILRLDNDGNPIAAGNIPLRNAFFSPDELKNHGIDPYLKGLTVQQAQEIDTKVVHELRNFLFGNPGSGGFDLAALNIQRGRDHGLPDFNSVRRTMGLQPYRSFDEITSNLEVQFALSQAYASVDDIDAWVGMLAEDHDPGASVGETLKSILKQQFEALRDADRFWYERDFRGDDLEVIRNTTLTHIIYRNSGVRNLYPNVFIVPPIQ